VTRDWHPHLVVTETVRKPLRGLELQRELSGGLATRRSGLAISESRAVCFVRDPTLSTALVFFGNVCRQRS
jgi:hypothetical protein